MASAAAAPDRRPSAKGGSFARRQQAKPRPRRVAPPLEHRILVTATLCLLAFGAVMVYSASSPSGVIAGSGLGTGEFVRYLIFGGLGLVCMQVFARGGLGLLNPRSASTPATSPTAIKSATSSRPAKPASSPFASASTKAPSSNAKTNKNA